MRDDMITTSTYHGTIEESGGRRMLRLIPEGRVREYEKRMLTESGCPYSLPVYFISEEGKETAYYDFTGQIPLEVYWRRRQSSGSRERESGKQVSESLKLLSGILECLKGLEGYLIFSERYSIHQDLIFVNPDNGGITIAFWPDENPEGPLQERIIQLIDSMHAFSSDDTVRYLCKLKELIEEKNPGLDGLIRIVGILRREAEYIFWDGNVLRETDQSPPRGEDGDPITKKKEDRKTSLLKPAVIQASLAAALAAVFFSGCFDPVSFAGLAIISAGADLWIMRRLQYF